MNYIIVAITFTILGYLWGYKSGRNDTLKNKLKDLEQ